MSEPIQPTSNKRSFERVPITPANMPTLADYDAALVEIERLRAALQWLAESADPNKLTGLFVVAHARRALSGDEPVHETSPQWTCSCGHVNTTPKLFMDRCSHCGEHRGSVEETGKDVRTVNYNHPDGSKSELHMLGDRVTEKAKAPHVHAWIDDDGVAVCGDCREVADDWFCPTSPTKLCRYTRSHDSCDFCGQPEERK